MVSTLDFQSREPEFGYSCCHFEVWAISFTPRCHSSLSCINEYMDMDIGGFRAVISVWLRSRDGVGMNKSASG